MTGRHRTRNRPAAAADRAAVTITVEASTVFPSIVCLMGDGNPRPVSIRADLAESPSRARRAVRIPRSQIDCNHPPYEPARRKGRITSEKAAAFLESLADLPIEVENPSRIQVFVAVRALAAQHQLTSYDAAYLELCIRHNLPIAS